MRRYQRFVRHRCALEGAASQHFLRIAVAIADHRGHEPFAIELSADPDPIAPNILLFPRSIAPEPALLHPRLPADLPLLPRNKLSHQPPSAAAPAQTRSAARG